MTSNSAYAEKSINLSKDVRIRPANFWKLEKISADNPAASQRLKPFCNYLLAKLDEPYRLPGEATYIDWTADLFMINSGTVPWKEEVLPPLPGQSFESDKVYSFTFQPSDGKQQYIYRYEGHLGQSFRAYAIADAPVKFDGPSSGVLMTLPKLEGRPDFGRLFLKPEKQYSLSFQPTDLMYGPNGELVMLLLDQKSKHNRLFAGLISTSNFDPAGDSKSKNACSFSTSYSVSY